MHRKWCRGEGLGLVEQRLAIPSWYLGERFRRRWGDDQLYADIVGFGGWAVN
jgi:hypothetical protein